MTTVGKIDADQEAKRLAEIDYFQANEEQDKLIERGIKLLTSKVMDLMNLCNKNKLDIGSETK